MPEGVVGGPGVMNATFLVQGGEVGILETRAFSGYAPSAQVTISLTDTKILTVQQVCMWPGHRYRGREESKLQVGTTEAVNHLLLPTFTAFLRQCFLSCDSLGTIERECQYTSPAVSDQGLEVSLLFYLYMSG